MNKVIIFLLIVLAFILGGWLMNRYYQSQSANVEEEAQVLLEKVKSVAKLTTIEGYFSEIYTHKEYIYDYSPFTKKALLRVKAKVSVGYDLGAMKMETFPETKKIIISNLPDPMILTIDHDIDYYDIQEGLFNSFSNEDYTKLNANAKDFIRQQAMASDLLVQAESQGNKMLEMIQFMVESSGWQLEYKSRYEEKMLKE